MNDIGSQDSERPPYEIDVVLLIRRLWESRWWIVAWIVTGMAVAVGMILWTPSAYRAQTVAAVASPGSTDASVPRGQLGGLAALVGISLGSNGDVEETLAVMRSREFSERFILDRGLMPGMFPRQWDKSMQRWKKGSEPSMADAYQRFHRKVRAVSQDKKTGLVSVSITWPDPVVAARLANDLTDRLNKEMRSRAAARTEASLKFLQDELDRTVAVDTRQAINRLIESQINQRMYANVTEEFALRVVDRALPADPRSHVGPGKAMRLIAGFLIGAVLGCLFVIGAEFLRNFRVRLQQL